MQRSKLRQRVPQPEVETAAFTERQRRLYYQDIVYNACSQLDAFLGRHVTKGNGIVCGTVEEPSTEVQDCLSKVLKMPRDVPSESQTRVIELGTKQFEADEADVIGAEAANAEMRRQQPQSRGAASMEPWNLSGEDVKCLAERGIYPARDVASEPQPEAISTQTSIVDDPRLRWMIEWGKCFRDNGGKKSFYGLAAEYLESYPFPSAEPQPDAVPEAVRKWLAYYEGIDTGLAFEAMKAIACDRWPSPPRRR